MSVLRYPKVKFGTAWRCYALLLILHILIRGPTDVLPAEPRSDRIPLLLSP